MWSFVVNIQAKTHTHKNNSSKVIINRCKIEETRKLFKQTMCCRFLLVRTFDATNFSAICQQTHSKCMVIHLFHVACVCERDIHGVTFVGGMQERTKNHMNVNEVVSFTFQLNSWFLFLSSVSLFFFCPRVKLNVHSFVQIARWFWYFYLNFECISI